MAFVGILSLVAALCFETALVLENDDDKAGHLLNHIPILGWDNTVCRRACIRPLLVFLLDTGALKRSLFTYSAINFDICYL